MADAMPYAHSGDRGWQGLDEHLEGVSRRCGAHAAKLGLGTAGTLIGLLHDLGKSSQQFQTYLKSFHPDSEIEPQHHLRGKIDHSTAGAQCILQNLPGSAEANSLAGQVARLLALCIVSHHSGLIDCLDPDGEDRLTKRLKTEEQRSHAQESWRTLPSAVRVEAERLLNSPELLSECRQVLASVYSKNTLGDIAVQFGLLIRLLFSCLIDADRTDTADFEKPLSAAHRLGGVYETWEELGKRLNTTLAAMPSEGEVNARRRIVSEECFAAAARPRGIYTLTVPTGGGKTLAALRFALEHARLSSQNSDGTAARGFDRIVFVSPYISIVDQNAEVARRILEPTGVTYASVVLEHHSNLVEDDGDESRVDHWRRRVLAENWDAPVVFTTMVQVLEALFGAGTKPVRRLHALANAVIVFDEVQTLPIKLVHLFNNAINLLAKHCGSTIVLCTATQPLLECVDKVKGAAALAQPSELISDVRSTFQSFRRYVAYDRSDKPGGWTQQQAASLACEEANTYGSCLVVVNTKKHAREIYQLCKAQLDPSAYVVHLSTAMCPAHRTAVLSELRGRLGLQEPGPPIVCVSTQLIEAGVDIDFATVVRDLAGLDSIAQAAGRCNRHGSRTQHGRVHIVKLPDPGKGLEEILKGRQLAADILGLWRKSNPEEAFPLDSPEQMRQYYERAFFQRKAEMSYSIGGKDIRTDTLLSLLGRNGLAANDAKHSKEPVTRMYLHQSFASANECFELIEKTHGIVVPYRDGKGEQIVTALAAARDLQAEWQLLRAAQPYTISVYDADFRKLSEQNAIYEVSSGKGVYCLHPEHYDDHFGLSPEAGLLETLNA